MQIGKEIVKMHDDEIVIIAHSLGASMLLRYLSEYPFPKKAAHIFLIATPFWSGSDDWIQGLKLKSDFVQHLPKDVHISFYHSRDDEEVPFEQLVSYRERIPVATFTEIESGGHQLGSAINVIANDVKSLEAQ